jgi:hypothetical protein
MGTTVPTKRRRFEKYGADRSAIANYPPENWPKKARKLPGRMYGPEHANDAD